MILQLLKDVERAAFAAILLVFTYLFIITMPLYGPAWDTWEYYIGDKNLEFYKTLDSTYLSKKIVKLPAYEMKSHPAFDLIIEAISDNDAVVAPILIWPFGPMTTSIGKQVMFVWLDALSVYDAHHFILGIYGVVLFLLMHRFGRRTFGWPTAFASTLCLMIYPRFLAHLHFNIKDIPSCVWFCAVILMFHTASKQRSWWRYLIAGALWGIALATKANALFLPAILVPWFAYKLWIRRRTSAPLLTKAEIGALVAFPFVGILFMCLGFPLLLVDFPNNFAAYVESIFERGHSGGSGVDFSPLINAIVTMPLPILLLAAVGLFSIVRSVWRHRYLQDRHLLVLLWTFVPVGRVLLPGANDFDGIRHWLEFVPGICIIAGLGVHFLLGLIRFRLLKGGKFRHVAIRKQQAAVVVLVLLWLSPTIHWLIQNNPNQLVFYNSLVGGVSGARKHGLVDATDYWGSSYRQGFRWLYFNAEKDSLLYVGVAEHIAWFCREQMLRGDIKQTNFIGKSGKELDAEIKAHPGPVYIMYIVRPTWYKSFVKYWDKHAKPIYEVDVEGEPILKIIRLK